MPTTRELLGQLPSPIREQAFENVQAQGRENILDEDCEGIRLAVDRSACWGETPQGHEYWMRIADFLDGLPPDKLLDFVKEMEEERLEKERKQAELDARFELLDWESISKYKSRLDWAYTLDEPLRYKLLNALASQGYGISSRESSMHAIITTFSWASTEEGEAFWRPLAEYYNDLDNFVRRKRREMEEKKQREIEARRVTFSSSFKEMISQLSSTGDKVAKILHQPDYTTNEVCNYITMRRDMASYLPAGREHKINDSGRWVRDGRQEMKPAKLARKIIHDSYKDNYSELTDTDFENFANAVKSYISVIGDEDGDGKNIVFDVVEGEELRKAYHEENYSKVMGTNTNLWGSCMRYSNTQKFLDIYVKNNDVCKLLVARDVNGLVLGRALLWLADNGDKCMDTIYSAECLFKAFKAWAIDNEYRYKSSQSCHHHMFDMYGGSSYADNDGYVSVKIKHASLDFYPFMDSLQYLEVLSGGSILSNDDGTSYDYVLRQTDGRRDDGDDEDGRIYCEWHDESYDEDDVRWVSYTRPNGRRLESYIHYEDTVNAHDGEYYLEEDCEEVSGRWYLRNDDNIIEVNGEYYLLEDCYDTEEEGWLPVDECEICLHDGQYHPRSCMTELATGGWVTDDNMDEYLETLNQESCTRD